jgi:hypothetical protein
LSASGVLASNLLNPIVPQLQGNMFKMPTPGLSRNRTSALAGIPHVRFCC